MFSLLHGPGPDDAYRARTYRVVFALAGVYNLAFGAWAGLRPLSFFRVMELPAPNYPSVWACLGMVVGVYGVLYLYAAWRLDRAWPIIAIGLLGKVLGPAGLAWGAATGTGELPGRMVSLLAFNDLCWWLPFGLFLLEGTRAGRRLRASAPPIAAAVHLLAMALMALTLRPGTEVQPSVGLRAAYIGAHPFLWALSWPVWMAAAMLLAGFCAWWGARVRWSRLVAAALVAAAVGMLFDLSGEALYLGWLPWLADGVMAGAPGAAERFAQVQRMGTVLTGVFANGLYTVAGIALTLATPGLSGRVRAVAWAAWAAGSALVAAAAAGSAAALVACSAVLFPLVVVACVLVWRELKDSAAGG
jgi:hypothetical protein